MRKSPTSKYPVALKILQRIGNPSGPGNQEGEGPWVRGAIRLHAAFSGFFILSEKQDDLRQEHSLDLENHVLRGRSDM